MGLAFLLSRSAASQRQPGSALETLAAGWAGPRYEPRRLRLAANLMIATGIALPWRTINLSARSCSCLWSTPC
jgi:hypothetical protein